MNCEVFFEINGTDEEKQRVSAAITHFLFTLEHKGDIAALDGSFDGKSLITFQSGRSY